MAASQVPDLADVLAARRRIAPYLQPTPLYRYPALDAMTGARVWVKHENHQPVGAFKVRGGVNLVSQLSADERRRGVIASLGPSAIEFPGGRNCGTTRMCGGSLR
ncbi:MAG TPA: pyridoxal-phosphate dependent enzyme [Streptosporangiaceae bacterium]|nr:pyridoxal-phosphate dependent enzyme [Streptosporangiaceae bacterium]